MLVSFFYQMKELLQMANSQVVGPRLSYLENDLLYLQLRVPENAKKSMHYCTLDYIPGEEAESQDCLEPLIHSEQVTVSLCYCPYWSLSLKCTCLS